MKNSILGIVVGAFLTICLLGSLMVPVVNGFTEETHTWTNEGVPYATPDEDTHTIVVSSDGSAFSITVDGEESEIPDMSLYGAATLVYCEDISLRLYSDGSIYGDGQNALGNISRYVLGTVTAEDSVTINISGTDVTSTTYSFDDMRAYISPAGDYVLCQNPCVDSTSTIMIIGGTTLIAGNQLVPVTGIGTVDDFSAKIVRGSAVLDSVDVQTSEVDGNLVRVDKIVIDVTYNSNPYVLNYTYFLAPATIVYDNPGYIGGTAAALMVILPVILIVGFVAVMAFSVFRRDD